MAVERERLSRPKHRLIVAVSGGADSVCLLDVLVRLNPGATDSLVVVHVDHGFRADSARDASFVRGLADRLGVACDVVEVTGLEYARQHGLGLEQAGRALRYQALAAASIRHAARAIATGHTQDDSVESVVMHLLRGAGTDGLRGIAARATFDVRRLGPLMVEGVPATATVVRPLLEVRRHETTAYCEARGLTWRTDPMNDDPSFLRSRVRHHLLPTLRTYNPAIDAALFRTAAVLREERGWLDSLVARRRARLLRPTPDGFEISLAPFRRQPPAVQRRLVRYAVGALGAGDDALSFESVERMLAFAAADRPRRLELPRRLVLSRLGDCLRLSRTYADA